MHAKKYITALVTSSLGIAYFMSAVPNVAWSRGFDGEVIRCESRNFAQSFCAANTRGGVRLVEQRSRSACIEGKSWTFDRRGIYVRDGCAADFQTGNSSPFQENTGQKRSSNTGTVIAGAVIGAGLLWALSNAGKSAEEKKEAQAAKAQTNPPAQSPANVQGGQVQGGQVQGGQTQGGWRNPDEAPVSFGYNKLSASQRQAVDRCFDRARTDAQANGAQAVERTGIENIASLKNNSFQISLAVQARFNKETRARSVVCEVSPTQVQSYQLR
jgi:Protein of unknown function (DUF3011)